MYLNNAKNKDLELRENTRVEKYICRDCHRAFYEYNNNLCPYCDSIQSGERTSTLYIISDCFSSRNGKQGQFSGYTTIVFNDRFDLEDKYNIEYFNQKAFDGTTNNYGELMGILDGLAYYLNEEVYEVYDKVIVLSDSEYVILGIRDRMEKWRAKNWTNSCGKVKNLELWQKAWDLVQAIKQTGTNIEFRHQKGHLGKNITKEDNPLIYFQEKCDTHSTRLKQKIESSRK